MIIKIYPQNPNEKHIAQVAELLRNGGVIIYPTDGVYAFGCSLSSPRALERLKTLTGKGESKLSVMCADLSHISDYVRLETPSFKLLRRHLPGPFTFILPALSKVPDKVLGKRKSIGVRMADNNIPAAIIRELGAPLATCSVRSTDEGEEYITDPDLIHDEWNGIVDMVIDGGPGSTIPTTVVDLTGDEPEIIRQGGGELLI